MTTAVLISEILGLYEVVFFLPRRYDLLVVAHDAPLLPGLRRETSVGFDNSSFSWQYFTLNRSLTYNRSL